MIGGGLDESESVPESVHRDVGAGSTAEVDETRHISVVDVEGLSEHQHGGAPATAARSRAR